MRSSSALSLAAITVVSTVHCAALSQTATNAPTRTSAPNAALPQIFAVPMAQFQRINLKKQLVQAAKQKDESLIISLVEQLAPLNPTSNPTLGLMDESVSSSAAPLDGAWKLLFTNAKDAEAPARTEKNKDETFGDEVAQGISIKTGQRINASKGECINFIRLMGGDENENKKRPFDQLEITILMTPLSNTRVRLDFQKGRALNSNAPLPFLKDFTFNFPPPAFNDVVARIRGLDPSKEPQAYFDILYVDNDIRAHKTGEGKIFVQMRDS